MVVLAVTACFMMIAASAASLKILKKEYYTLLKELEDGRKFYSQNAQNEIWGIGK